MPLKCRSDLCDALPVSFFIKERQKSKRRASLCFRSGGSGEPGLRSGRSRVRHSRTRLHFSRVMIKVQLLFDLVLLPVAEITLWWQSCFVFWGEPKTCVFSLAGYVEALASKLGMQVPDLTPKQVDMWQTRLGSHMVRWLQFSAGSGPRLPWRRVSPNNLSHVIRRISWVRQNPNQNLVSFREKNLLDPDHLQDLTGSSLDQNPQNIILTVLKATNKLWFGSFSPKKLNINSINYDETPNLNVNDVTTVKFGL